MCCVYTPKNGRGDSGQFRAPVLVLGVPAAGFWGLFEVSGPLTATGLLPPITAGMVSHHRA